MAEPDTHSADYESLPHTADIAFRVRGGDIEELFSNAGNALIDIICDPGAVADVDTRSIEVTGNDREELLVAWLEEILFAFESEGFVPCRVEVVELSQVRAVGHLHGEDFDPDTHPVRQVVKAVTYHNLRITESGDGCEVTVVLDV